MTIKKPVKTVLQIVIKNTSTMDFATPLLLELSQRPDYQVYILYCELNKQGILRNASFFSNAFKQANVTELDLSDFFKPGMKFIGKYLAKLFRKPTADYETFDNIRHDINLLRPQILLRLAAFTYRKLRDSLKTAISFGLMPMDQILSKISPDVVLFDNRSSVKFPGSRLMYDFFDREQIPVVLLPHAPHYISEMEGFMPFDPQRPKYRPDYIDAWLPFSKANPEEDIPEVKYARVGYPAFDNSFRKVYSSKGTTPIRCLYIGRKFLAPGVKKPAVYDPFTLEYEEVFQQLSQIQKAFAHIGQDIQLVVKPHPSSNFNMVQELLDAAGFTNAEISHEPFYGVLPSITFCITPFSTSTLIPVMANIPTIFLNDDLQKYVNSKWTELETMYTGMHYYLHDPDQLEKYIHDILNSDRNNKDIDWLRAYYPDNALSICRTRIESLIV